MSLVVVGSIALDSIETPGGSVEKALGGSAVYASIAASYRTPVRMVGIVGEDFRDEHRAVLEARKIDCTGVETVAGGRTFHWKGKYGVDPNQRETLATELNVFEDFRPALPEGWEDTRWLFLGNIDPELQLDLLNQCTGKPFAGCDTMNYWIEGKREELLKVLEKVNLLFVNDSEARQLSGESNLYLAAREIMSLGPEIVVIKKGEHGAFLMTRDLLHIAPAFPLEAVLDPTGAGDVFAGGFLGSLASDGKVNEDNLRRALVYGTILASFTCEKLSVDGISAREVNEIGERIDRFLEIMKIEHL
ncbi:MAG: sugar kinase [Candidatus Latescibacteria bacterium]|nr:sugar kinase [bacterium]MBD3425024.1 sugar kinase [Candidatus Latescibacterota bacterium]